MSNKIVIQILTIVFIAALVGALYWSWGQTQELQKLNDRLTALNADLAGKSDSLEVVNEKLKKERDGYVKLFSSSQEYEEAKEEHTPEAYFEYVQSVGAQNFGDTRILSEITAKLNELMNNSGFVQIEDSNGTSLFQKQEKLFPNYNFYKARQDLNVRNGVIGNSEYPNASRRGVVREGQIVNVIEEIQSGDATWARISYYSQ